MSVESRMDEFKKVADKKAGKSDEVEERMNEFEEVPNKVRNLKEKESQLPYGLKRYMACPNCTEIMEIHEVKKDEAVYRCRHCKQDTKLKISQL